MKQILIIMFSFSILSFLADRESADMQNTWNRFEGWLKIHAPHLPGELNAPATDSAIRELESKTGVTLPQDFKKFLKIHNGQKPGSEGLVEAEELLSTASILSEWTAWKQILDNGDLPAEAVASRGIKPYWWNSKWIPITHDGSGNHYCIDLDPARGGKKGQVIRMWHDSAERELVASSFKEWISDYVTGLEKGKYVYSKDWGGIVDKDDLE